MPEKKQLVPVSTATLVLRCYVRRSGRAQGRWVAHCVDWDLWAVGASAEAAKASLEDAIKVYAQAVTNTEDRASISRLMRRRAPLRYIALWHVLRLIASLRRNGSAPLDGQSFEEMPFDLALAT